MFTTIKKKNELNEISAFQDKFATLISSKNVGYGERFSVNAKDCPLTLEDIEKMIRILHDKCDIESNYVFDTSGYGKWTRYNIDASQDHLVSSLDELYNQESQKSFSF